MHIRYNAVSSNAKTEKQWNKLGYKVKENVRGVSAWSNAYCVVEAVYYEPCEVELMNEEDKIQYKKCMKEKRANYGTACQWLYEGCVVKENAEGTWGSLLQRDDEFYFSGNYIYYHKNDVEYNPTKAKELAENFPRDYNYEGQAWWI